MIRRRHLLAGIALAPLAARAQPEPIGAPAGRPSPRLGPGWDSASAGPGKSGGLPAVDLQFLAGTLDGRITFSRAAGPATFFNSAGIVTTAGTNVARFDTDPATLTPRGLLLEETRTNVLVNSQAINSWPTKTDDTITDNNTTSPDGTVNASLITAGVGGTDSLVSAVPTVAAGSTLSYTFFCKRGNFDFLHFYCVDTGAANGVHSWLNMATGVAGSTTIAGTATSPTIIVTALPNSWWRVQAVITMPGTSTTANFFFRTATGSGQGTRVINGTYYIWGAQIEVGNCPTSYMLTTASAATRAADVASMAVGAWFTGTTGTLVVDALQPVLAGKATTLAAFTGASGKTGLTVNASNQVAMFDTTGAINTSLGSEPAATAFKCGFAFAPGAQRGCLNGGSVITAAAGSLTPGATALGIGYDGTSQQPSGHLRRIRYWPRALSASELQAVTV